ncbi:hypothetical protein K505DRAFT_340342 [Melanomma pulvis-pyrius CBS 109.77]|uniref:Zn(2)-C6 fungal-type domain-containing protein n=1 Tax=Melanomma pulvis-pyrius CBS 109.77 TaxID=1314802 RepID=A0A6A6X202_9PLEO|nr:hypothetical protein K505DRAFT_340342 [Melanomma pulvis-pyrius CBS 109.77]
MDPYSPDMEIDSVETQPPPRLAPSRRNADKPPKLRSSCDICANAKVKCDRERPVCQRCINSGMRCNYSVSRRMGKPPRKDANGNPMPKKSDAKAAERRSSTLSTPERDSINSTAQLDDQLSAGVPDALSDVTFEHSLLNFDHAGTTLPWHDLNFMSDPNNFASNDSFLSSSTLLALENSVNFMDSWGGLDHGNTLTRVASSSSEAFTGSDTDLKSFAYPSEQSPSPSPTIPKQPHPHHPGHGRKESCTNLASTTLQSLHLPQNFCQSNPTSAPNGLTPAASIDQVLATNRRAITTFNQLLQCPCSSNSGLVLALSLIILKVLSCYSAIGRSSSSRAAAHGSVSSGSNTPWEDKEMVLDIPISMGQYQIDAEDEMHLKLQLVINELRKVSKLIDAFAGRYCRGAPGGDGIYGALEKFLRAELKNASKELNTALRNREDM